jgi:hypothetical protein
MSKQEHKSSVVRNEADGPVPGFQSKEARDVAHAKPEEEDPNAEPGLAEVEVPKAPTPADKAEVAESMRMVKVRSRTFIPPFRYGPKMYTLPANKEVLIPLCVKRHLEEKQML